MKKRKDTSEEDDQTDQSGLLFFQRCFGLFSPPPMGAPLTCDVKDNHGHSRISYVARDQTPEALLTGRVPKLQSHLASRVSTRESRETAKSGGERERGREREREGRDRQCLY